MLIPNYWAETVLKDRVAGEPISVRRFGWSENSQEEAQQLADKRAQLALNSIVAGEPLEPREAKVAYNGADGLPIREEIIDKHDDVIITRNAYGALCLNTPNVLFADVDFPEPQLPKLSGLQLSSALFAPLFAIVAFFLTAQFNMDGALRFAIAILGFVAGIMLTIIVFKKRAKPSDKPLTPGEESIGRIERFLNTHPEWNIRVYSTPADLRLMAIHRTFDPVEPEVAQFFDAVKADPIYVKMCLNQQCFRARVSPKPWRIGIDDHLVPRPGVWPINPDRLPDREKWVAAYERKSMKFASCKFVADMGSHMVDPTARAVQELHDDLCQAQSDLTAA